MNRMVLACSRARSCHRPFGLHVEERRAEQRVAGDQRQPAEQREGRRPIKRAAGIGAVSDRNALDQPAEDHPLRESGKRRAGGEGEIPTRLAARDGAELEGHAAEDQRQQHDDHRQIERRHDHRIGARKCHPQSAAAEDEPGLVAVPERRDGAHHLVALPFARRERKQDADARGRNRRGSHTGRRRCRSDRPRSRADTIPWLSPFWQWRRRRRSAAGWGTVPAAARRDCRARHSISRFM